MTVIQLKGLTHSPEFHISPCRAFFPLSIPLFWHKDQGGSTQVATVQVKGTYYMTLGLTRTRAWKPPSISVNSELRHHLPPAESSIGPGLIYCIRGHQLHQGPSAPGSYLLCQGSSTGPGGHLPGQGHLYKGVIYWIKIIYAPGGHLLCQETSTGPGPPADLGGHLA